MHRHPRPIQGVFRAGAGGFQSGQNLRHVLRQLQLRTSRPMTARANGRLTGEQGNGGRLGGVGRVTHGAARCARRFESPAMLRAGKSLARGRMAFGARLGYALRAGGGKGIADGAGIMDAVTIHTFGHTPPSGGQRLAVNAGFVLGKLVHGQLWIVFAHEIGVAVAFSAKFGNTLGFDPHFEAVARTHRDVHVRFILVAAVTIGATDRAGEMDVVGELPAHPFHDAVTIEAGILPGTGSANQQDNQRDQQHWRFHCGESGRRGPG